jgi:hypothetical protein
MTRRDYCPVCSSLVSDWDVCCSECSVSLCYDCATCNDSLSRLAVAKARIFRSSKTIITNEEYCQLYEYIYENQNELFKYFENDIYYEHESSDSDGEGDETQSEIMEKLKLYLPTNKDKETFAHQKYIKNLLDLFDDINFTCNMCFQGIVVKY